MSVTGPWVTQKTHRSLQIVAPRSASAGSSRQNSMAAQMLPRSLRIRGNSVDLTGILGRDGVRKVGDPVGVTRPQPVFFVRLAEPVAAELAQRLEEPQTSPPSSCRRLRTDLSTRDADELRDVRVVEAFAGTYRPGRVELEAAGEHGQALPEPSLGLAQELVAPVDRRPRASAAGGTRCGRPVPSAPSRAARPRSSPSSPRALRRTAASSRASGMPSTWLQMLRIAAAFAASTANPCWTAAARSTNSATASDRSRASGEASPSSGNVSVGTSITTSPITPSAWRLVARIRTSGQARSSVPASTAAASCTCSQLSRIEEWALVGEVLGDRGHRALGRMVLQPECGEHGLWDQLRILHGRELHEPHPVGVLAGVLPSRPEREPGLAHAADAGERHEPCRAEGAAQVGQSLAAAHEARQLDGQVAGRDGLCTVAATVSRACSRTIARPGAASRRPAC